MKKLTLASFILALLVSGCANKNLGSNEIVDEEENKLHDFEAIYKQLEGKYKHVKRYEKDGSEYIVHEYVTPEDGTGYQIIKSDGRVITSICVGEECEGKNYVVDIPQSSTSTLAE